MSNIKLLPMAFKLEYAYEYSEQKEIINQAIYAADDGKTLEVGNFKIFVVDDADGKNQIAAYMEQADEYSPWPPYDAVYSVDYGVAITDAHMVFLDRIYIREEFRGQGLGSEAIKKIISYCKDSEADYLFLCPQPLMNWESREDGKQLFDRERTRLVEFYNRFGFRKLETTEERPHPYYFLALK